MTIATGDILDSFAVAVYLNIRLRHVWQLVQQKRLVPFVCETGGYRFRGGDVLAYQAGQQT
jgi:hypothetical protein